MFRTIGEDPAGRFHVEIELANYGDVVAARHGLIKPDQVRRMRLRALVDPRPARLVVPKAAVRQLGLPVTNRVRVRYANGRIATRDEVEGAHLTILGRTGTFHAMVEPRREPAVLTGVVLEELDLLIDRTNQRLAPRDPRFIICDID